MIDDAKLLEKLREYQENQNLTQVELAKKLGVTRESVYRWRSGRAKLRPTNKRAILRLIEPAAITTATNSARKIDYLTAELLNEWKYLNKDNRLKTLRYINQIKTPQEKQELQAG